MTRNMFHYNGFLISRPHTFDLVLAHYEQSGGFDQISHALSNIHGLYGCSCNLLDVISVYSLNPGKLPGRFSYKRPGYEANVHRAL